VGVRGTHLNMFGEERECPGMCFFQVLTLGFTFDIQTTDPSLTSTPGCSNTAGITPTERQQSGMGTQTCGRGGGTMRNFITGVRAGV